MLRNETELFEELKRQKGRFCLVIRTDRADFTDEIPNDLSTLLEIRCFDEKGEFMARRSYPGESFRCRAIVDGDICEWVDEKQYLDIDTTRHDEKDPTAVFATGGGRWHLPQGAIGCDGLIVRKYYAFDAEGVAGWTDWRLVRFVSMKGGN